MRLFGLALMLSLADLAVASAQTATPNSENGRYSFNPIADGVLRLDTRTGQVSPCSRTDAGWACKVVPDGRSALETAIARLQGETRRLEGAFGPSAAATGCAGSAPRKARRAGTQGCRVMPKSKGDCVP